MLEIALHSPRQHRQFQHDAGRLLLARAGDEPLWLTVDEERARAAPALMEIVPRPDGVELQMAGCEGECYCGQTCGPSGKRRLELPARFTIGDTRFEITDIAQRTATSKRPLEVLMPDRASSSPWTAAGHGPSPATLSRWFEALGTLHRWAASSQELYVQAARSAVESIGLDGAIVLRRRDHRWEIVASHLPHPELGIHCDMAALDQLLETPRTLFHGSGPTAATAESGADDVAELVDLLQTLEEDEAERHAGSADGDSAEVAIVVSPLLNAVRELSGAIYGFRSLRAGNARRGIRYLEAHWIELLASAVTEGIARLEHEAEVDRRRVLLEQAFATTLENDPRRMIGERREVTLLFADLRGFSGLTHSLGVEQTYELLGDVMDTLTAAVMDHDGLIIDYYGDGLAAMWNAPAREPDHPELACRAALRMLENLPAVEELWAGVLNVELRLGIGVHTGIVQVGNAGSNRRMKYGPRGANVHLASRVEAATKAVGLPVLVTGATASRLSNRLLANRLCRVQLPGIKEPVDLYAIRQPTAEPTVESGLAEYQQALELFEQGRLTEAAEHLTSIDTSTAQVPTAFLAAQIEQSLGRRQARRRSDQPLQTGGVIALHVK